MPTSNVTIVTTCTKKKIATPFAYLKTGETFDTQKDLLKYWRSLLDSCPPHKKIEAVHLYKGRGFKRALLAANQDTEKVEIISAGLGLVSAGDKLVPYNLTTSIGTDHHVKNHIGIGGFDPQDWWNGVTQIHLQTLLENRPNDIFVIAVSRAYLEMILNDLLTLTEDQKARIRIVGNELEQVSDFELFDFMMPYDLRLNSIDSAYRGSKIDFAQRAAHHFIREILSKYPKASAKEHQEMVFAYMESLGSLTDVQRNESIPNEDLRELLLKEWRNSFGRMTRLLMIIRQKYGFSCSENRLKLVMKEIQDDINKGIDVFEDINDEAA